MFQGQCRHHIPNMGCREQAERVSGLRLPRSASGGAQEGTVSWSGFGSLMNKRLLHSKGIENAPSVAGTHRTEPSERVSKGNTWSANTAFRTENRRAAAATALRITGRDRHPESERNSRLGAAKTFCKQNNGSLRTVICLESMRAQTLHYGHWGTKERGFRGTRTEMATPTSLAIMIREYKTMWENVYSSYYTIPVPSFLSNVLAVPIKFWLKEPFQVLLNTDARTYLTHSRETLALHVSKMTDSLKSSVNSPLSFLAQVWGAHKSVSPAQQRWELV